MQEKLFQEKYQSRHYLVFCAAYFFARFYFPPAFFFPAFDFPPAAFRFRPKAPSWPPLFPCSTGTMPSSSTACQGFVQSRTLRPGQTHPPPHAGGATFSLPLRQLHSLLACRSTGFRRLHQLHPHWLPLVPQRLGHFFLPNHSIYMR